MKKSRDGSQFGEPFGAPETEFLAKTRFLPHVSDFWTDLNPNYQLILGEI